MLSVQLRAAARRMSDWRNRCQPGTTCGSGVRARHRESPANRRRRGGWADRGCRRPGRARASRCCPSGGSTCRLPRWSPRWSCARPDAVHAVAGGAGGRPDDGLDEVVLGGQPRAARRRRAREPHAPGVPDHAGGARRGRGARRVRPALGRRGGRARRAARLRRQPDRHRRRNGRTRDHDRRAGAGRRLRALPAADRARRRRGPARRGRGADLAATASCRARWPPARRTPDGASGARSWRRCCGWPSSARWRSSRRGCARSSSGRSRPAWRRWPPRSTCATTTPARTRTRSCGLARMVGERMGLSDGAARGAGVRRAAARRRQDRRARRRAAQAGAAGGRGMGDHAPAPGLGGGHAVPRPGAEADLADRATCPRALGRGRLSGSAAATTTSRWRAASSSPATPTTR